MAAPVGQCAQAGCDAAATGICIDNLRVEECPHFSLDHSALAGDTDPKTGKAAEELVRLQGNVSFSLEQADAFLRMRSARVIALVAGPNAGKTTLVSAIYELCRRRELGDVGFAACETIRAMEERCHLSRTTSGRSEPDTQRNSRRSPVAFLHLRVVHGGAQSDLLLSDRTGENFIEMMDTPDSALDMPELMRCDCLVILVDGSELADPGHRPIEVARARRLWLTLHQTNVLTRTGLTVQLVLTKLDWLQDSAEAQAGQAAFDNLVVELKGRGAADQRSLSAHSIASRPVMGNLAPGSGLAVLIASWLPRHEEPQYEAARWSQELKTPYEKLMIRVVGVEQS